MDWHKIAFPENVFPFDEPTVLIEEAQKLYEKSGFPTSATVFQEINHRYSRVFYFTPEASSYCAELFDSYRGGSCVKPVNSGKPIVWVAGDPSLQHLFHVDDPQDPDVVKRP